jgi:hypothetical protein
MRTRQAFGLASINHNELPFRAVLRFGAHRNGASRTSSRKAAI